MRKLVAFTQVSVDGVMQAPGSREEDPSNGFTHGGWAIPFVDDALNRVIADVIAGEFDLLLGRRTYEIFYDYWPKHGDDPISKAYDKATKYVVTRTLERLEWKNSERISGDVAGEIRRLKESRGPELHVWGSSQLLQTLVGAGLVDEHRLWIFPVVLGKGKRLFGESVPAQGLSLVATERTPSGVVLNTYQPAGPIPEA